MYPGGPGFFVFWGRGEGGVGTFVVPNVFHIHHMLVVWAV
jgi:hypothetical protein